MKMKHYLFILCLGAIPLKAAYAQKTKLQPSNTEYNRYYAIYQQAIGWNDWEVATQAVYQLMSFKTNEHAWRDTLAMLYYTREYYVQTLLLTEEILKEKPDKEDMLEMAAMSYERIGAYKESLEKLELLMKKYPSLLRQYQVMQIEYRLQRFGECLDTAEKILNQPESTKETVRLNITNSQYQDVPIAAATYNVLGMVSLDLNITNQAIKYFEESVKIFPDFVLAQKNLQSLQEEKK